MNKHVKRALISLGSAVGGTLLTLLMRRHEDTPKATQQTRVEAQPQPVKHDGLRGTIVDLVSDILAETYRKLKIGSREGR